MILCEAVKGLDLTLYITGDGPQKQALAEKVSREKIKNIKFWSHQKLNETTGIVKILLM